MVDADAHCLGKASAWADRDMGRRPIDHSADPVINAAIPDCSFDMDGVPDLS